MARQQLLNLARRAATRPLTQSARSLPTQRTITTTSPLSVSSSANRKNKDDPFHESSSATLGRPGFKHEGSQSRTDDSIVIEYPETTDSFPSEPTIQGRGGPHLKRTLPQFSLEGRVAVITGGARGLGLVMAQALVASGADIAIVDLNSNDISSKPSTI